jgi:hypothetical protein
MIRREFDMFVGVALAAPRQSAALVIAFLNGRCLRIRVHDGRSSQFTILDFCARLQRCGLLQKDAMTQKQREGKSSVGK